MLFGSNVGTTVTGWLVAVLGLNIKIDALALPLIAAGMLMRLTGPSTRRGGWGRALAGFSVLFLGIAMLRDGIGEMAAQVWLPQGEGLAGIAALIGVGIVLTVLMQSSSAATALVLTAAQGGLMDLPSAAAVVIGTNIGSTVTAVIAAVGATSNARRAAAAHVLFNLITGAAALAALPFLLALTRRLAGLLGEDGKLATALALFHTLFNVLGVLLMWPLAARLAAFLLQRFRTAEEDEAPALPRRRHRPGAGPGRGGAVARGLALRRHRRARGGGRGRPRGAVAGRCTGPRMSDAGLARRGDR